MWQTTIRRPGDNDKSSSSFCMQSIQVPNLDHSIQSQVNDAFATLHGLTNAGASSITITPTVLNNFLAPISSKVSTDQAN